MKRFLCLFSALLATLIVASAACVADSAYVEFGRPSADGIAGFEHAPYFGMDADGNLTVINAETNEIIGRYENTDRYLSEDYQNPAVFILESWTVRRVCSMQTGEVLWTVAVDESEHDFGSVTDHPPMTINATYTSFIEGLPQRMIVSVGEYNEDVRSYMTDNEGRRVTDDYQKMEALVWNGQDGAFLVGSFDKAAYEAFLKSQEDWEEEDFEDEANYLPEKKYGGTYKCGLIDANGEPLTDMVYKDVKALSLSEFALTCQDGTVETFKMPATDSNAVENPLLERARRLESYLDGSFATVEVPAPFADELSSDYGMIARADQEGRTYALAVRKTDAPPILQSADIYSFDDYKTLLILPDGKNNPKALAPCEDITEAMTPGGRARVEYRRENGFTPRDESKWQIGVYVYNRNFYISGVSVSPIEFFFDLTDDMENLPERISKSKVSKSEVKGKALFDTSAELCVGDKSYVFNTNRKDVKGYFRGRDADGSETWYFNPKAWKAIMKAVQDRTGQTYKMPSYENLYSATLQWPADRKYAQAGAPLQYQTVTDKDKLKQIKKMLKNTKRFGESTCTYAAFLTLDYKGAKAAIIPIATDGCNTATTEGGLSFEYGISREKLLGLFDEITP